ncbi:hypothetical protein [Acetonema longum]|uniref:Uncharacterized protein n=1 Tax=Acetonema longum DSM 6540 TaxID=1009370 RepID=F7NKE5_9FIRM|nr:hypothetical protein [Acetonema longum]EGO63586.1 hypothetical protein ALO_12791 [Acetonema longum DSM 6540]
MGLDFSHCQAHWGYISFNRFRTKLAAEIGMNLDAMQGFNGDKPFSDYNDPIIPLLDHSDCDGELTLEECRQVAPRLRELISKWPDDDRDKQEALNLADGMERAAQNDESLQFY